MRRNDREITEFSEMTDVMKRCDVCRLALNDEDGYPSVSYTHLHDVHAV